MFALHKVVDQRLYALVTDSNDDSDEPTDALNDCFENWQDVSYLRQFFKRNPRALSFCKLNLNNAIEQVLHEGEIFYSALLEAANSDDLSAKIDNLFEPLHKLQDASIPILQVKAYGAFSLPCTTRIYAIRLNDGAYIIVGGLIKASQALQETNEGNDLLELIDSFSTFLLRKGLINSSEIEKIVRSTELY